jgi:hypothetical protein
MRRRFISWFAVVLLLLLGIWIGGAVAGAVIPLFGGMHAKGIGATALSVAAVAETILVVTECLGDWASRRKPEHRTSFPAPKRYGNRKHYST